MHIYLYRVLQYPWHNHLVCYVTLPLPPFPPPHHSEVVPFFLLLTDLSQATKLAIFAMNSESKVRPGAICRDNATPDPRCIAFDVKLHLTLVARGCHLIEEILSIA